MKSDLVDTLVLKVNEADITVRLYADGTVSVDGELHDLDLEKTRLVQSFLAAAQQTAETLRHLHGGQR